ncbi:hypothetical protein WICMUC_003332 [Wickerhamomyces mucosus]|uniref:Pre-mRNA-splicing factor CWC2 n=1 Tax=Wickerhamomyces mucosus TaxID=1378264 RepID=A0A9P8TD95_9ASCO|nr:hypothetical protein WICMUC_003332 [Wickerhamomyces mucosus]
MSDDIANLMLRPARQQISLEELESDELPPQNGIVFNIWFQKWSGGGGSNNQISKAKHKVNIEKDTGFTNVTKDKNNPYICLYYAKGICVKGKNCQYLHRIPQDDDFWPQTVDCFGREKFSEYREDMSGIGSFNNVNKTLYIGGSLIIKSNFHDLINENFKKFGKIDKINVINNKNCCFVSYKNESNAQFAKEAMMGQSLYGEDIMVIKWANEDPNPIAKNLKKRQLEQDTNDMIKNLLSNFDGKSKQQKILPSEIDASEAEIEEPEEDDQSNDEPEEIEIKQIEQPSQKTLLNNTDLSYLKFLKRPEIKPRRSLINAYDSDSD